MSFGLRPSIVATACALAAALCAACAPPADTTGSPAPTAIPGGPATPAGSAPPTPPPASMPAATETARDAADSATATADAAAAEQSPTPEAPRSVPLGGPAAEAKLRGEVKAWRAVPYKDNGTTRQGIGNTGFVRAVVQSALGAAIPLDYDDQIRTGKLVDRKALAAGDLVFFEGLGIGIVRLSRTVGIYLGKGEVALARKEDGVTVIALADRKWDSSYKTARRLSTGDATAPTFDIAKYGANREALLREIAKAWSGTLYRNGGTTFTGIGNEEFVREVYGAVYETDLDGDAKAWEKMGRSVPKDKLEPGDIILYDADPLRKLMQMRHAGIYVGSGDFVAAVRGSAVTILKVNDAKWKSAYRTARRINPDALPGAETPREAAAKSASTAAATGSAAPPRSIPDAELRLRDVEQEWHNTPYKLGGNDKSGIDCSAFSKVVYKDVYAMDLPRTAAEQELLGRAVSRSELQPGDLVFFRTQGMGPLFKSRHVGVYLGGGEFAQASGRHGVTVSRLDNRYWSKRYHAARRIAR